MASTRDVNKTPNWEDDILPLIQTPYWIPNGAAEVGSTWIQAMQEWGTHNWNLAKYEDVKERAASIHNHLRSRSMPITRNPDHYWPEEALELFRKWANNGFPKSSSATPVSALVIPEPIDPPVSFRVRRDIMTLSREELAVYQSKLDDILHAQELDSKWQELGRLHAYWCLHYQEATFLWHRAYLRYVEELIDFPIPYWNGYAKESSYADSKFAGIPPMFLEEKYLHPELGPRDNPLRFAKALNGKSKVEPNESVTRNSILSQGPSAPGWEEKIEIFKHYHEQIEAALKQKTYTTSESAQHFGVPWTNIPDFTDDNPDIKYPFRHDFDGLFEQVHDNFHGWVGGDMADNETTAFDPIFLSYHANMDRLAAIFMDANPENQFSSRFPLQPFMDNATKVNYDDPRRWHYTTIGDMAKDTRALGYMYGEPANPDYWTPRTAEEKGILRHPASGGQAIVIPGGLPGDFNTKAQNAPATLSLRGPVSTELVPYVVFTEVGCTITSYKIDVFVAGASSTVPDAVGNPDFIGQVTRLGMGRGRDGKGPPNMGRCRKPTATRVLPAGNFKDRLARDGGLEIVVTDLETNKRVDAEEYSLMSGFIPKLTWLPARGNGTDTGC